jgi:hypothetical protein
MRKPRPGSPNMHPYLGSYQRMFFFEKKNQKTFASLSRTYDQPP